MWTSCATSRASRRSRRAAADGSLPPKRWARRCRRLWRVMIERCQKATTAAISTIVARSVLGRGVSSAPQFICTDVHLRRAAAQRLRLVNAIGPRGHFDRVSRLLYSEPAQVSGMKFILSHARGTALCARRSPQSSGSQGKYADPRKGFATMYSTRACSTSTRSNTRHKAGARRVMLGSDAPVPIGDPEPRKVITNGNFTDAQKMTCSAKLRKACSGCVPMLVKD